MDKMRIGATNSGRYKISEVQTQSVSPAWQLPLAGKALMQVAPVFPQQSTVVEQLCP
jgi:hypothetical protein